MPFGAAVVQHAWLSRLSVERRFYLTFLASGISERSLG